MNNQLHTIKTTALLVLSMALATAAIAADASAGKPPPKPAPAPPVLHDKTLVAWISPANTTQRGSSAIAVQEGEDFDALVFGERVPGRWMAGSDFFRRTQDAKEQTANLPETADPATRVQIAVVYAGNQVTIYRDGKPYAVYRIDKPRAFAGDSVVLLGLRYLGRMGAAGFFHGTIEEARLYDQALDAKTIASLTLGAASEPKPRGQWTFDDGTTNDCMKNYPPGQLCGGARIADRKLHLNSTDAYALIAPKPAPQGMFYQGRTLGGQWDTWLYYHEGTYYLYILAGPGVVLRKADGVTWLGTGSTWKSPRYDQDKKFFLNFSEWRGDRQTIFFAESNDLLRWKRLGGEYEFRQDDRWYKPKGRWDCIVSFRQACKTFARRTARDPGMLRGG